MRDYIQELRKNLIGVGLTPVHLAMGVIEDKSTWLVDLGPDATDAQRTVAAAVVEAFDLNAAPAQVIVLSKYQFMNLLTPQERITLRTVAKQDPVMEDALIMLELAQEIRGDDPLLAQMFGYCVSQNYISATRAQEIADALGVTL